MTSLCMLMMRWGSWPPWIALTIRTLELNPTVSFSIVGDTPPTVLHWPSNCKFVRLSMGSVMRRADKVLGASPGHMRLAGTASKISDFKPMLGALFPELLTGCAFWGYMQEDQFLGSLRSFLDEPLLRTHDTISPLPAPMYNAGPFMIYRHSPQVDSLFRRSSQWRKVAKASEYLVFDEWWNPKLTDHMPAVIGREARKGRLRAYTSGDDSKTWLVDDFIYSAAEPSQRDEGRAAEQRAPPDSEVRVPARKPPLALALADAGGDQAIHNDDQYLGSPGAERRWYDDALLLTRPQQASQAEPHL